MCGVGVNSNQHSSNGFVLKVQSGKGQLNLSIVFWKERNLSIVFLERQSEIPVRQKCIVIAIFLPRARGV